MSMCNQRVGKRHTPADHLLQEDIMAGTEMATFISQSPAASYI